MKSKSLEQKKEDKEISAAILSGDKLIPYKPASICNKMYTQVPIALASETQDALAYFKDNNVDPLDLVMRKLKYLSRVAVCNSFDAEQVDALALAIVQFEKGNSFILGDMTGIGKGRICAGVIRYAHSQKMIPLFITMQPNLYSDIYRDIKDIGGLATNYDGKPAMGIPFIINGKSSKNDDAAAIFEKKNNDESIRVFEPYDIKKTISMLKDGEMPKGHDYILGTYSQFAGKGKNLIAKQEWFTSIADKCILIMDESHNAAGNSCGGDSNTSLFFTAITEKVKATLFSSATYAKTPSAMKFYIGKTDISKIQMSKEAIVENIITGGTQMQEYISSNLVRSGQMIRREKSYDNCVVEYVFTNEGNSEAISKEAELFDKNIALFQKMVQFSESANFKLAIFNAVKRFASKHKVSVIEGTPRGDDEAIKEFIGKYSGQYCYQFVDHASLRKKLFNLIQALFFSMKSEDLVKSVINQLTNENLASKDIDGKIFKSSRKPVISVVNTMDNAFAKLGYKIGDYIEANDFAMYYRSMIDDIMTANVYLYKIGDWMLDYSLSDAKAVATSEPDEAESPEKKKERAELKGLCIYENDFHTLDGDFNDGGKELKAIIDEVKSFISGLPLSPIDYIIEKISDYKITPKEETAEEKKMRDALNSNRDRRTTFIIKEVTGRKFELIREGSRYKIIANTRETNKFVAFENFNKGLTDVLIINEAGSTGTSAHSKYDFDDRRPRVMFFQQFDLDINIQVQKRGRVNRTGQLNFPTYIYLSTRIPSELRLLMMLKRKMRSLDANVSGNQIQTSDTSELLDSEGNQFNDMDNIVGDDVMIRYIDGEGNHFYKYIPDYMREGKAGRSKGCGGNAMFGLTMGNVMRCIQIAPSRQQKQFYDAMNKLFSEEVIHLKEQKMYSLETEVEDLKAAVKNKIEVMHGDGDSYFTGSVYEEDNYITNEMKPLKVEEITVVSNELCSGRKADDFMADLKKTYTDFMLGSYLASQLEQIKEDITGGMTEDEIEDEKARVRAKKNEVKEEITAQHNRIMAIFEHFNPDSTPVIIPDDIAEVEEYTSTQEAIKAIKNFSFGKFIGYKIHKGTSENIFTPSNIELFFATISGAPKISIRASREEVIDYIMLNYVRGYQLEIITKWKIGSDKRIMAKILSGNLFEASKIAQNMVDANASRFKSKYIVRFSAVSENDKYLRLGVRLEPERPPFPEINFKYSKRLVPLNAPELLTSLEKNFGQEFEMSSPDLDFSIRGLRGKIYLVFIQGKRKKNGEWNETIINSPFAHDAEFIHNYLKNSSTFASTSYVMRVTGKDKKKERILLKKCLVELLTIYRAADIKDLKRIFDYMYGKNNMLITMQGESSTDIQSQEDIIQDGKKGIDRRASGSFAYYPKTEILKDDFINLLIEYKEKEPSPYKFGVIYLNRLLDPQDADMKNLVPTQLPPLKIATQYFSMFKEDEKTEIFEKVRNFIKSESPKNVVGIWLMQKLTPKIKNSISVIGYKDAITQFAPSALAEIIIAYVSGEIKDDTKIDDVIEESDIEELEENKIPLTLDSAQDFVIMLEQD